MRYTPIILMLFACAAPTPTTMDVVTSNAESYLMGKLNDPDSYELVSMELVDSTTYRDNIEYRLNYFKSNVDQEQARIERHISSMKDFPTIYTKDELMKMQSSVSNDSFMVDGIQRISDSMGSKIDSVAAYDYLMTYRSNNALGAKVLNELIFQVGGDLSIINVAEEVGKMLGTPGGIPGYDELLESRPK